MANWTTNELHIGSRANEVLKFILDDNMEFDFRRVVPRPATLMIEESSLKNCGLKYIELCHKGYNSQTAKVIAFSGWNYKEGDFEKARRLGLIAYYNKQKYGYSSWYDWCYEHWGTKWNVDGTSISNDGEILRYDTANGDSSPVILALSKIFPDVEFNLQYADEDFGYGVGEIAVKNGEYIIENYFIGGSPEARAFAAELLGYSDEDLD